MFSSGPPFIHHHNMPPPPGNAVMQHHGPQLLVRPRALPHLALPPQAQFYSAPSYYYEVRPALPSDAGSLSSYLYLPQPNPVTPGPVRLQRSQTHYYTLQVASTRATYPLYDQSQPGPSRSVSVGQFERPQGPYRNTPGPFDRSQPGFSRNASNGFDRPSRPFSCPFDRSQSVYYKYSLGPFDQSQPGPSRPTQSYFEWSQPGPSRHIRGPSRHTTDPKKVTVAITEGETPKGPTQVSFDHSVPYTSRHTPSLRQRTPHVTEVAATESVKRYQRITQSRDLTYYPMSSLAHSMSQEMIDATCEAVNRETAFFCPRCGEVPKEPVTGPCGHTRCRICVVEDAVCECGQETTWTTVNVLIQRIINSLSPRDKFVRLLVGVADLREESDLETASASARQQISAPPSPSGQIRNKASRTEFQCRGSGTLCEDPNIGHQLHRVPAACLRDNHIQAYATPGLTHLMDIQQKNQERYMYARDLIAAGYPLQAVPYLVKAAAFGTLPLRSLAKDALVKVLQMLYNEKQICQITTPLHTKLMYWCSIKWLGGGELDCILCCQVYRHPVTTPCGHTYCRPCIERSMDYKRICPLCSSCLYNFNVAATADTSFLVQVIQSVGQSVEEVQDQDDRLPLFVCTVAYPSVPCPLFVFEPRYRLMIRRCMRSATRRFGMVCGLDEGYADYGTILEIRDCVLLPDGRSLLSTVGISRFHILEKDKRDGYDVARVESIHDYSLPGPTARTALFAQNRQTRYKGELWLQRIHPKALAEIESAFGPLPPLDNDGCYRPDGPAWMWWLLAILPLRNEIKVMILSSLNTTKRLYAIERTLDLIEIRSVLLHMSNNPVVPSTYVRDNRRQRAV